MMGQVDIHWFADVLEEFFLMFDALFMGSPDAESLLIQTKESLEEKVSHNESAMAVIMALGGRYDSAIDRAKIAEVDAMLQLLLARKELRLATRKEVRRDKDAEASLKALFGICEHGTEGR